MSEKYKKPLPRVDEESRGWWEALARHELYVQRCRDCGSEKHGCTHGASSSRSLSDWNESTLSVRPDLPEID